MRTNNSPAVKVAIISALRTAPMTNRELHVVVSSTMMREHNITISPQSVRSRTKELEDAGMVERVNSEKSHKSNRKVTVWSIV